MNYDRSYPDLKYLVTGYHQDWMEDYTSNDHFLRDFVEREKAELVQRVVANIRGFLKCNSDPRKAHALFTKEWHGSMPYPSPKDSLNWLEHAAEVLEAESDRLESSAKGLGVKLRPNIKKYTGLYLLMCQFDSDWETVFKSEVNLLRQFKKLNAREDVEACVGDIKRLLDTEHSDTELFTMLTEEFRSHPPFTRVSEVRPWLTRILGAFRNYRAGTWR